MTTDKIKVAVRVRPFNRRGKQTNKQTNKQTIFNFKSFKKNIIELQLKNILGLRIKLGFE